VTKSSTFFGRKVKAMCSQESSGWSSGDILSRENETIYVDGISTHLRDRIEVQGSLLKLINEVGKNYNDEVEEIKILERGSVRVTFTGTETANALINIRKMKLPGKNNRSKKYFEDNIRIKWSWNKMAREAAKDNLQSNSVYAYIDPKDYMPDGINGFTGDEVEIQNGLLSYIELPAGSTCQFFKRPASFYIFLPSETERDRILEMKQVRTDRSVAARCTYRVGPRQSRGNDVTLPPWSASAPTYVAPPQNLGSDDQHAEQNQMDQSENENETASTKTSVTTTTMATSEASDEKLKSTVAEIVEATLHKFMADQNQQNNQVAVRQQEEADRNKRLDRIEMMMMKMAERQLNNEQSQTQLQNQNSVGSSPKKDDVTPNIKLLKGIDSCAGQSGGEQASSPESTEAQKLKKRKADNGKVQNVPSSTSNHLIQNRAESTEAESELRRKAKVRPAIQQKLRTTGDISPRTRSRQKTRTTDNTNSETSIPAEADAEQKPSDHEKPLNSAPQ
jgi:hypothetical protein